MAYTTPKTWTVGDVLPAADLNTHVRDNIAWITNDHPRCRVYRNSDQTISTSTDTAIAFGQERFDVGGMHSTSTNTSRVTIPSGGAGLYLLTASVRWAGNATGYRTLSITVNGAPGTGTTIVDESILSIGAGAGTRQTVTTMYQMAAGDYAEVYVWQNSGGNLACTSNGNYSPEFTVCWIAL